MFMWLQKTFKVYYNNVRQVKKMFTMYFKNVHNILRTVQRVYEKCSPHIVYRR